MRELAELQNDPSEGIRVVTSEDNMLDVTGIIEGPGMFWRVSGRYSPNGRVSWHVSEGTPYAGGYFRVKFKFTEEFPAAPPKCSCSYSIFYDIVGLQR